MKPRCVLAVPCNQTIPTGGGSARADALAVRAPLSAWKRRSCGDGVKGPRLYDWALATLPDTGTAEHGHTRWLLIRRNISDPTELAYYLCYSPADTTDEELIRVAGTRWAIEECFQTAKGQVGLDEYQVRRLVPAHHPRHVGPRLPRSDRQPSKQLNQPDPDGLIPLTLGEVRRLLAHLITKSGRVTISIGGHAGAAATNTAPAPATTSEDPKPESTAGVVGSLCYGHYVAVLISTDVFGAW